MLVETLLVRSGDGDVDSAEAAVDRLAAALPHAGGTYTASVVLRLRALMARAHGDDRLSRLSGSLPRDGHRVWLRRAYGVGRGDAVTAAVPISYPVSRNRRRYEGLKPLASMFAIFGDVAERQARHQEWQQ